jgi:glutathione-regulated potassium-efflux system ancillary protein KefC
MTEAFTHAALWLGLAVLATIIAYHLRISMALVEILVGMAAGALVEHFVGPEVFGGDLPWLRFLASSGAVVLTFLAGAELEPAVLRAKWREVTVVGLIGFAAPFLGCTAVARYLLHWDLRPSLLAGVALSTTSMAVVYAVMLETGLNRTEFGKGILGACFINDLGTVIALGLLFAPFTYKTVVFVAVTALAMLLLPRATRHITRIYAFRTAAVRTKWVLLVLFALGALALWSGSEAVLPAYIAGMVLAGAAAEDHHWLRRMRTLTIGLLTPFYFIRAGSLVALPVLVGAPLVFVLLLGGKVASKIFGLFPVVARFRAERNERWYYTLLMSTGLTFGTISALYGLTNGIVTRPQYSFLVATVIARGIGFQGGIVSVPRHF